MHEMYNYAVLTLPAAGRLRGRNVLTMLDLAPDELASLSGTAQALKAAGREQQRFLQGKSLAMLFEKPSLRTRVSFEIGMTQLGGHAVVAHGNEFMLGKRETPEDVARVLSRYADAIVVRTHEHEPLQRFAAASTVPVINGLSQAAHPVPGAGGHAHDQGALRHAAGPAAGLHRRRAATTWRSRWPKPRR